MLEAKKHPLNYFSSVLKIGKIEKVDSVASQDRYQIIYLKDLTRETVLAAYPAFVNLTFFPQENQYVLYFESKGRVYYLPLPLNISNFLQTTTSKEDFTTNELRTPRIKSEPGDFVLNGLGGQAIVLTSAGDIVISRYTDEKNNNLIVEYDENKSPAGIYIKSTPEKIEELEKENEIGGYTIKLRSDNTYLSQREKIIFTANALLAKLKENAELEAKNQFRISSNKIILNANNIRLGKENLANENAILGKSFNDFLANVFKKMAQEFSKLNSVSTLPIASARLTSICLAAFSELKLGKFLSKSVFLSD